MPLTASRARRDAPRPFRRRQRHTCVSPLLVDRRLNDVVRRDEVVRAYRDSRRFLRYPETELAESVREVKLGLGTGVVPLDEEAARTRAGPRRSSLRRQIRRSSRNFIPFRALDECLGVVTRREATLRKY